jgi:hypothetical protein
MTSVFKTRSKRVDLWRLKKNGFCFLHETMIYDYQRFRFDLRDMGHGIIDLKMRN